MAHSCLFLLVGTELYVFYHLPYSGNLSNLLVQALLMKKLIILLFTPIFLGGCKKAMDRIAEDAIVDAMVSGQWKITSFKQNGTDITSDFSEYKFQYYRNKTVDAIRNGTVDKTGSWDGNSSNMTTWADFPGAVHPLTLINGTWNITKSSWTYVEATQTNGTDVKTMRLDKL